MGKIPLVLTGLHVVLFAAFSSSNTYQLNSYGLGPGGTSNASSSTYRLQGDAGGQSNGISSGATKSVNGGEVGTEQLNVPGAPTLSNGSGQYYNKLALTIDTGNNPSDATYSVAVSTDNFLTTSYVQVDGTLGMSPVYQTFAAWGGSGGTFITGLAPSTPYKAKVDAMQGLFTNTAYSAATAASTVEPSVSFSVSPNTTTLPSLLPNTVVTSSPLAIAFATNAASGGGVYISGQNSGLDSVSGSHTIASYTGDLGAISEGFGAQASNASQTAGGPFALVSPFDGTGNSVGAAMLGPLQLLSSNAPITGGTADVYLKAKVGSSTPAAGDYQEVLVFLASANF